MIRDGDEITSSSWYSDFGPVPRSSGIVPVDCCRLSVLTYRFPYIKFHCVIGRNPRRRTAMYDLLGFLPLAL